jgi:ABC-type antimicrobial peptide transport system permease subunit
LQFTNVILYNRLDIENLAQLPLMAAVILVGVSMFLTFIAGLMPASAAARKNPVEALRSE